MTKSEALKALAQRAIAGENVDREAERFMDEYYPESSEDAGSVLDALNGSYIARRFFKKSRSWFFQKMNNNIKNGKPTDFSEEEWAALKSSFITLSDELRALADSM